MKINLYVLATFLIFFSLILMGIVLLDRPHLSGTQLTGFAIVLIASLIYSHTNSHIFDVVTKKQKGE